MRAIHKKALALLCAVTMLCMAVVTQIYLPARAAGEYFELSENNANLFINVNQEIELQDVSVVVNGQAVNGKDVAWTCTDNENVSIANGVLKVSSKGLFSLSVDDKKGHTANVNVVTKLPDETEFVLYEEDFEGVADGALPQGWTVAENLDVTDVEASQHATYVPSPQVKGGKLIVGNGVQDKASSVLLPSFLDAFGDYAVEMDFSQNYVLDNIRYCGAVLRAQRAEAGGLDDGYYYMFRRASQAAGNIETFSIKNPANTGKTTAENGYPNAIGATQNFKTAVSETTDYQREGYDMTAILTAGGATLKTDLYRSYEQTTFAGDPWSTGDGLKGTVPSPALTVPVGDGWSSKLTRGAIALRTVGCQMTVSSVKVSVPVTLLAADPHYYVPSSEQGGEDATFEDLKFGVLSDIHVHTYATGVDTNLPIMLNKMKDENVDAVLITGDTATTGIQEEYDKFLSLWDSVFPDPETAPVRLVLTGNHEFEQAIFGHEDVQAVYDRYMAAYGYDTVNQHITVNGYHFIGMNSENAAVYGLYSEKTAAWLKEQLDAAVADDPYRPIFVAAHQPLPNTTFSSEYEAGNSQAIYDVLKNYPQAVYFSGHTHYPIENERNIDQDAFTCIDVTSMQYVSTEGGTPSGAYSAQGGLIVTVEGVNKQIVVDRYRMDENAVRAVKNPWKLSLPLKKSTFTYTDARKDQRTAPVFAADAQVTVSDVTVNSLKVSFPSATHDDYVRGYTVYIKEKGSGGEVVSKYFVSDFWLDMENMAASQTTSIGGLAPNMDYVVEVTAVESFGLESEPISADFTTLPVTTPSPSINRADLLDVDFLRGFGDNSPYRLGYELYGSSNQSKIVASETLGRNVLSANGWINYAVTAGMLDKITDSVTMEIAFMVPGAIPKNQCLFGNPETYGMTIEFDGNGVLQAGAHIAGGWKFVKLADLKPDTWYHLVVTIDGENVKAYLNGAPAGATAAAGPIKHNKEVPYLTIGANVDKSGNAAYKFIGEIALARVYTSALSADEAAGAYAFFENDPLYQTIYDKQLVLERLLDEDLTDAQRADAQDLIARAEALLVNAAMTKAQADAYIAEAQALIDEASAANPSVNWQSFEDGCADFSLLHARSDNWQKDKNPDINKQFLDKGAADDADEYLIWKVDGYIRTFDLEALQYGTFGNVKNEVKAYLSEDGETWRELNLTSTAPVPDPNYAPGAAVSWLDSTVSPKVNVGGEYSYLKVVVKKFDSGIKWSIGIDNVLIRYSDKADDIPLAPGTFTDQAAFDFVDELANLDKVSSKSDNWDLFPNHSQTGLSVIGRKDVEKDSWITYKLDDKAYTDLQVAVQAGLQKDTGASFFSLSDLKVEARTAGSETWADVAMKLQKTDPINDEFELQTLVPVTGLPVNTEEIRISLLNAVGWTAMLDSVSMNIGARIDETAFVDELENLNKTYSESGGWQAYNPHPETGLSVVGRKNASTETSLSYRFDGQVITAVKLQLQYVPDAVDINRDMKVLVRRAGSNEWTEMTLSLSAPAVIPGYETGNFRTAEVTLTGALPADVAEVKVQLVNDVAWALFLDRVTLNLADSSVEDNPGSEPGGETKTYDFTDEMESFDKIHDRSDNWELFNPHTESGLSVIGKKDAKRGYISYMRGGAHITDFAVSLQIVPAFFNSDTHLLVQVRTEGSDKWTTVPVSCAAAVKVKDSFSTTLVTPAGTLPANVEELRINLYNDVAYVLMVDRVMLDFDSEGTDVNPDTGAAGRAVPALLLAATASGAVLALRKRRRTAGNAGVRG